MLRAMARSTIHYLRKRGLTRTAIAGQVGCERHTVARVLAQPVEHRYGRPPRSSPWAHCEPTVVGWLETDLPVKRKLELARADATTPYTASAASWYRFVAGLKRVRAAAAAPVIRFEGLAGEFLQVDWGEAWVPLGTEVVRRVFLAARLKYSRTLAVRWTRRMTLEPLLRGLLAIAEELGGVPWAWVFDNMKTVTLGRVEGNQYAVPTGHLGQAVDVRLLATDVVLSRDGVELARHARCTGRNERRRDPAHYAEALRHRPRARLVLERDTLCQLGPEVTAYVAAVCQRRRERMAAEIDALVALRDTAGPAVLRSTVARALAREAIGAEYLPALAGLEPALPLAAVPVQDAVDRDLASYETFVQPGRAG